MNLRTRVGSMKQMTIVLGVVALSGAAAYADDVPARGESSTEQAQARQFGIYFGGMASQYDLCVRKGFLAKGDRSAEEVAKSILEKMRQFDKGPDQSAFVHQEAMWRTILPTSQRPASGLAGAIIECR
jgi:hypothetical protein